ncbi:NAD(P)H-binding protein [Allomuricauda sp. d1]|uniref:NAD(P)H-binding protein n=1 Tax=Allomuricauda sp. d1 TaxID=3136725 RepID=UPI0031E29A06
MEKKEKTAIVLGATGLVGGILLDLLLKDERYVKIVAISRRKLGIQHPKLETHLGDLFKLENFSDHFHGDEVFCCVGSTQAKTPDLNTYRKVDYGIPIATAQLCKQNGIKTIVIVSALGADPKSSLFYNRTKGEMEEAVLELKIEKTHIVQPALIGGHRDEKRPKELFFKKVMGVLDFLLLGPLRKYRMIAPEDIATAMIWLANNRYEEERIDSETIKQLAKHGAP